MPNVSEGLSSAGGGEADVFEAGLARAVERPREERAVGMEAAPEERTVYDPDSETPDDVRRSLAAPEESRSVADGLTHEDDPANERPGSPADFRTCAFAFASMAAEREGAV